MGLPITSRGFKGYAGAVLAGGISASLFAIALTNSQTPLSILAYISTIPLFVAGLGAGYVSSIIACLTGILALAVVQHPAYAIAYFGVATLPTMIITLLALRYRVNAEGKVFWYPEGLLITAISLYPVMAFLTGTGYFWNEEGGFLGTTTRMLNSAFEPMKEKASPDALLVIGNLAEKLAYFLPSVAGAMWILFTIFCLFIAQKALRNQGWNLRTGFTVRDVYAPSWLVYALAVTGLAGAFAPRPHDFIGVSLSILLALPFFFAGLGVIHSWAATTRLPLLVLAGIYVILCTFWPALLVVLLGVLDQWINFRQRFVAGSPTTH